MSANDDIKPKGRPIDPSSYFNLLNHYNRDLRKVEKVSCECGKVLYSTQLKNHMKTKMHETLLKYKQLAEAGANMIECPKPSPRVIVATAQTNQGETIDELLLKLASNPEYRQKVKKLIDTLDAHET